MCVFVCVCIECVVCMRLWVNRYSMRKKNLPLPFNETERNGPFNETERPFTFRSRSVRICRPF